MNAADLFLATQFVGAAVAGLLVARYLQRSDNRVWPTIGALGGLFALTVGNLHFIERVPRAPGIVLTGSGDAVGRVVIRHPAAFEWPMGLDRFSGARDAREADEASTLSIRVKRRGVIRTAVVPIADQIVERVCATWTEDGRLEVRLACDDVHVIWAEPTS